jgi:Lipocalin-like domain
MKRIMKEGEMRTIGSLGMIFLIVVLAAQVSARRTSGQAPPAGDEAKRFIGTWRLISDTSTGLMYYDGLGNMAAQVMPSRARAKYAGTQPTPDEAKAAITGYLAYFGTYTVNERAHTITHHRKASINPGQVGDDAVRGYEFASGDRVILTPAESGNQVTWERMR